MYSVISLEDPSKPAEFGQYSTLESAVASATRFLAFYEVRDTGGNVVEALRPQVAAPASPGVDFALSAPIDTASSTRELAAQILSGMVYGIRSVEQMQEAAKLAVAGVAAIDAVLASPDILPASNGQSEKQDRRLERTVVNGRTMYLPKKGQ